MLLLGGFSCRRGIALFVLCALLFSWAPVGSASAPVITNAIMKCFTTISSKAHGSIWIPGGRLKPAERPLA
jgi:predicted membrane metal-binding protein